MHFATQPPRRAPLPSAERLLPVLRPQSIALAGGAACAQVIRQCRRMGFTGDLWPIHPSLHQMEGLDVRRSLEELPRAPDVAFVAVNRHTTVDIVRVLASMGAGGAVCYASGFAEAGVAGGELQERLVAAAGAMPIVGPNCHGLLNYLDGVALWPEQHGGCREARGVALVTQSGNIALNLTMQRRGLPLGYVITLGNQAVIELADVIAALAGDERVTAIGLHIEGIRDPAKFAGAVAAARDRGVAVAALKSGRSDLSASLARSHTASLGGEDAVADAFLERAGVARVHSLPALLETLKLLHVHGPLPGSDIASMSSSGGEAGLVADVAAAHGLNLRPLTEEQATSVAHALPELATVSNPLDYHNFNWSDAQALTGIYSAVMAAEFALTLLVLDFPRLDRCEEEGFDCAVDAFISAGRRTGARGAIISTLPETLPEFRARQLVESGIAPLCGLEDGLAAVAAAARIGWLWQSLATTAVNDPARALATSGSAAPARRTAVPENLCEGESKRLLAASGVAVPRGLRVRQVEEAVEAANTIGYPVAVKAVGPQIRHKTELRAVRLQLQDGHAVRRAAQELIAALGTELLVEEMVTDGVAEAIVGVSRDPVFGLYLVIGTGGVFVELLRDRRVLIPPASMEEILAAVDSLALGAIIRGFRGATPGDREALVRAVLAIQEFALQHQHDLLELDVNPLIIRPLGSGAVAVDALITLCGEKSDG